MTDTTVEARADAKAAKARAKALRPWYKKKRYIGSLGLGAILLIVIISSQSGDDGSAPPVRDDAAPAAEAGIGEPARDGSFEFTVHSIECGATTVGDEFLSKDAQGQFCFLRVTVENIGDEPQAMFASNQYLIDADERRFAADDEAAIYSDEARTIFEQINPGNRLDGVVVFDVPQDLELAHARLHDSAFSGGVLVRLS